MPGHLEAIYLRPCSRAPVRGVPEAAAIAGQGLEGDHAVGGSRQVTLLSAEAWRDACAQLGQDLPPELRRANLLLSGVELPERGSQLRVGPVVIEIRGETRPCELLDAPGRVGLCAALRPARRGGVYGEISTGGALRVGDEVHVDHAPPEHDG